MSEVEISAQLSEGRVVVLDIIHSTSQYIIDNLKYVKPGDVFVTENQTQGRGRRGNLWISPDKQSICLSMYWRLSRKLFTTIELSLIISFAVSEVLKRIGIFQVKIKWPNDLYVNGKKLAGILIEIITKNKNISHLIIGIGINVSICLNTKLNLKMSESWIDLKDINIYTDRNMLVVDLVNELRRTLKHFEHNRCVLFKYYKRIFDYLYNKSVALLIDGNVKYGVVVGINSDGSLLVMDRFGIISAYLKENISIQLL
ncbi:biotin-(acetyl-CoA-carboxylase) synthetase [Candidatus Blochmanniella vafra str. BVAF]|uniref:Biotin-(Acetyl-CoA-carboxylase) synthetase n=1 Tax=Blochmanniella vafra (strain BVAF) TaxID=859654 RepID=E8Q5U3_BLOVB|nr:biotin-(acetyl-CoA-carboxylase) synthetase [Candidatus Blochmannia vafer str. BVAF]